MLRLHRPLIFGFAALLFATALPSRKGEACLPPGLTTFTPDPTQIGKDTNAPSAPSVRGVTVTRGRSSGGCGGGLSDDCGDVGSVRVKLSASDDRTAPDRVGYHLVVTSGRPPSDLYIPTEPVVATDGELRFSFIDRGDDVHSAIHFTLAIEAEDLGGNLSPPVSVGVNDDGA